MVFKFGVVLIPTGLCAGFYRNQAMQNARGEGKNATKFG